MSLSDSYKRKLKKIGGEGGLTKAKVDYEEAAELLLSKGFSEEEAVDFLSNIYWATAMDLGQE